MPPVAAAALVTPDTPATDSCVVTIACAGTLYTAPTSSDVADTVPLPSSPSVSSSSVKKPRPSAVTHIVPAGTTAFAVPVKVTSTLAGVPGLRVMP